MFKSVLCLLLGRHLINSITLMLILIYKKMAFSVCNLYAQAMLSNT